MMKGILEKVSLWTDEYMAKEAAKMFSELSNIEDLHFKGSTWNPRSFIDNGIGSSISSEPSRHERCA
jgi:hypothetical protein